MPSVLSDRKVCQSLVPLSWKQTLQDLSHFISLEAQSRQASNDQALAGEIVEAHDRLISGSNSLLESNALDDLSLRDVEQIFARSVVLMTQIATSVAGDDEVLDTADCRMLHMYEADFLANEEHQQQLRAALLRTVSLDEQDLSSIEASVQRDIQQAGRKHLIVRAIRDRFGLWDGETSPDELSSNVHRFFSAIYPDVGITAEEVELIVTGTMIFFCIPFSKDELTTDRFRQLDETEQKPIREFLKRVNRFSQWQFAHFPVFGFLRGEDLDPALLSDLAARSGLSPDTVAREISTLTAVIPAAELDKYVVHDIWGHSWQACMLGFDSLYEKLATFADSLQLDEFAIEPAGSDAISLADCFVGTGDTLCLDETRFRRFVDLEVAERLPIAMTPVLAEVLADVAEFKLLETNRTDEISTSSALKTFPAKLDLTMRDVTYYFRQATKVFRLWASRPQRQERTVQQLIEEREATESAARLAVEHAVSIWKELEQDWLAPQIQMREEDGQLHVNVVARLALNFLAIHRETLEVYRQIGAMDLAMLPLKGMRDLMLISVAVFFEDSPSVNLWRVDEFLALRVKPLCESLARNSR